ncbi:hypothetical protein GCM10027416_18270 [Okibacterium endophyticum]
MPTVGAIVCAVALALAACATPEEEPSPWGAPAQEPVAAESPNTPGITALVDPDWVAEASEQTGIPPRALEAYAGAALSKAAEMPGCGLSWNTLAAIGHAESDHGRHGGSALADDGTVSPPIFGVPLDGDGTIAVPDTDDGELDGDSEHDRAMGPFQLIPQTWQNWHVDANADGREDPQNIDDSALAAANYVCRASGDMAHEEGWLDGIHAFNPNEEYVQKVADAANEYARSAAQE